MAEVVGLTRNSRIAAGVLGIVAVAAAVPAYLVGSPEVPSSPEQAQAYYSAAETFVLLNGVIPIAHVVTFLLFLAGLATVIGAAGSRAFGARAAVLAGGTGLAVLTAAGFVAEIVYPAAVTRAPDVDFGSGLPVLTLTMAAWLYHFAQAAGAVMMIGVAVATIRTGIFPAWFGWLSLAFAVVALTHTWSGIWAAWAGLVWILLLSVLIMVQREDRTPVPQ